MKIKGEPGVYIPYADVEAKLKAQAYGAHDLVDLGLFHSEHFVRDAMHSGKIKFQKINKRAVVMCRDDILDYWRTHRKTPYEPANNIMTIHLTISEVDCISSLVQHAQKRVDREYTKDDLFRNLIGVLKNNRITIENQPHLFIKRY